MLKGKHLPSGEELVEGDEGAILPIMFFYAIEGVAFTDIAAAYGFEIRFVTWDCELNADGWQDAYRENPTKALTEWQPTPPEGFAFGGKWHTEAGIEACFLKKLES